MIKSGIPNWNEPAVDVNGRWTQPWYNFQTVLYDRSGGPQGVDAQVSYQVAQGAAVTASDATDDAVLFGFDRVPLLVQPAAPDPFEPLALVPDRIPLADDPAAIAYMIGGR